MQVIPLDTPFAVRSWGYRILRVLDPIFLFHCGILEILDHEFLVTKWDPEDPGPYIFALSWGPGDIGSWLSDLAVGSCRSWILKSYFVVRSCRSWILIFGCGTCLLHVHIHANISEPLFHQFHDFGFAHSAFEDSVQTPFELTRYYGIQIWR